MGDSDLSSEAEVAAFIISSNSSDIDLAEYVLDAWMAMLIEYSVDYNDGELAIEDKIKTALTKLPYRFLYPLTLDQYLDIHRHCNNYKDVGQLYDFLDKVRDNISEISDSIKHSLNQQFCRVRYGGQYNSKEGNSEIWFRVSSVSYNWANTIYVFASDAKIKYKIDYITICRDYESDNGEAEGKPEYFYKAKDGAMYYHMPIDEFLAEEHEHTLVFSSSELNSGVLATIQHELSKGNTLYNILSALETSGAPYRKPVWDYLVRKETSKCIDSSVYFDNLPNRTKNKLNQVKHMILDQYPEIAAIDIDSKSRANRAGKDVGFEMIFELESEYECIDHLQVSIVSSKALCDVMAPSLFRMFSREYSDFLNFSKIKFE